MWIFEYVLPVVFWVFIACIFLGTLWLIGVFFCGFWKGAFDDIVKGIGPKGRWWKIPLCIIGAAVFSLLLVWLLFSLP